MVGPIDVKWKGGASIGYWVNYVTLTFDLTHDLDHWFFKAKFQSSCNLRNCYLIDVIDTERNGHDHECDHGGVGGCTV